MEFKDYYKILGVEPDAEAKFKDVDEAASPLTDLFFYPYPEASLNSFHTQFIPTP